MNNFIDVLINNLIPIIVTLLTTLISYIGLCLKKSINRSITNKEKELIIEKTVNYVEQISKDTNMDSNEKFNEAKEKALEWFHERNIKISDIELDIMLESAVKQIKIK